MDDNKNIPYKGFCWVIGTTSFRTAKLNLRIEQQLLLLKKFYEDSSNKWNWDNQTQKNYYEYMLREGFLTGDAKRKDKDAREKTSGLVNIGLIYNDRTITEAGKELLDITKQGLFDIDNLFNIDRDSYLYFKQLLKTSIKVYNSIVRPYIVLSKFLIELQYLSYDEFTFFLPLSTSDYNTNLLINSIKEYRKGNVSVEDIIYERLYSMDNYKLALKIFDEHQVTEDLICLIGMNRKSRSYDKPYYILFSEICKIFLYKNSTSVLKLFLAANSINQKPGALWRNFLFKTPTLNGVKKYGYDSINVNCPFSNCKNEKDLKIIFFKYLHVFKAMATLSDYFDLNRRYFNLTDTILFDDQVVKFDVIPRYFFLEVIDEIYKEAFIESELLCMKVSVESISPHLLFNKDRVYSTLSRDLGIKINTPEQATAYINNERYQRFNELINKKFADNILLELLECFENRNDSRIEELVTDGADIPTIFEYILGIIWYKVSERKGNILDFMKLSLEANLLPKTHASGGYADIIYEYEACPEYPKHTLLIEATLSDGTNQRRMEMEPVSRHLGDYRIKYNNPFDYSLFISTYLHKNVVSDFRFRKIIPYYGTRNEKIDGMKIISIDTNTLRIIISKKINYQYLYSVFDKHYELPLEETNWHDNLIKEATQDY